MDQQCLRITPLISCSIVPTMIVFMRQSRRNACERPDTRLNLPHQQRYGSTVLVNTAADSFPYRRVRWPCAWTKARVRV